jgi:DNA end-binding protein Ku
MKAIWKGNLSLALVTIPIKMYTATQKKDIHFRMLHKKCSTPLSYERFCPKCNEEVPWEDVVHGYEYEKGKFVIITDDEIERIPIKTSKNIEIMCFVDISKVPAIYFEKAYYLEPAEGGEKAYALLREVMKELSKVALAKITMRDKEHIAIINVHSDTLVLHTLYYADEVVDPQKLNIPKDVEFDRREIELAQELIQHFSGEFEVENYKDEFREAIMELIKQKIEGKEIKISPKKEVEKVIGLMDALKMSLERTKKKAG